MCFFLVPFLAHLPWSAPQDRGRTGIRDFPQLTTLCLRYTGRTHTHTTVSNAGRWIAGSRIQDLQSIAVVHHGFSYPLRNIYNTITYASDPGNLILLASVRAKQRKQDSAHDSNAKSVILAGCHNEEEGFLSMELKHRLHSSSFLGLPYRILKMNPQKELLWSF